MEIKEENLQPKNSKLSLFENQEDVNENCDFSINTLFEKSLSSATTLYEEFPSDKKNEISQEENEILIKTLREMVLKDQTLYAPTDDEFLIRFLRSMEFDCEGSFQLIQRYYWMQINYPKIYLKNRPSELLNAFENNMLSLLPHRDHLGRRIFVYKTGVWEPSNCTIFEASRAIELCFEMAVKEEETQKNGVVVLCDWTGISLRHLKYCTAPNVKMGVLLVQESVPVRFMAFHFINYPAIIKFFLAILMPFLTEQFRQKLHFHGNSCESLHRFINPDVLPEEYGGSQPPLDNSDFVRDILRYDDEFAEYAKYGYNKKVLTKNLVRNFK